MDTRDLETPTSSGDSNINIQGEANVSLLGSDKSQHFADTVGFVSDGKAIEKSYDEPQENIGYLKPSLEEHHTIEKFLSRPTLVKNLVWSQRMIETVDIMSTLREHKNFAVFRQKLAGFYGFRATANLKVVVNAQPFHSGILQLSFRPFQQTFAKYSGRDRYERFMEDSQNLSMALSGYPSTYLNVATQSDVTFSIPYCGQTPFMNLANKRQDFGEFRITSLVQLLDSTNKPQADVNLYLFFTDVELFGSTALTRNGIAGFVKATPQVATERAKKRVPQNRASEVAANVQSNPAPAGRGLISKGARYLVGKVPYVGDILQDIFDYIGLSKPPASQSSMFVTPLPSGNLVTYDGNINVVKLSGKAGQNTAIDQLGIEKMDEMEISTIVAKPTGLTRFRWQTDMSPHTLLLTLPVEPQNHISVRDTTINQYVALPSRLRYMANAFRYWRGTLRYTFFVSANKFHTGRLRFVYTVGGDPGNLDGEYSYSFNQIIDIRDGLTFSIDCPYFCDTPWRVVPQKFGFDGRYHQGVSNIFNLDPCTLQVYVENTLRAGGQAAQTVEVAVFVSGGPDFQLAGPIVPTSVPLPFIEKKDSKATEIKAVPQIETDVGLNDIKTISMVNLNNSLMEPSAKACQDTMGEEVSSVRELVKRYYPLYNTNLTEKETMLVGYPFSLYASLIDKNNIVFTNAEPFSYFSELYAFWRGGVRYNVACKDSFMRVSFLPQNMQFADLKLGDSIGIKTPFRQCTLKEPQEFEHELNGCPRINEQPMDTSVSGALNFEVPFYSRNTKILSTKHLSTADNHDDQVHFGCAPTGVVLLSVKTESPSPLCISRSCADDFTFGYLIGVPPVIPNITSFSK